MRESIVKQKFTRVDIYKLIFLLLLVAEFVFVVYANLFRMPDTFDNDAAKVFTHAIEIWNTKRIFIPTWVNETMLELDTALLLAVPIYGITGDIFLSFGIANIVILVAYYFFFFSLLKRMRQPLEVRLLACLLLTIPYSFGQLLYFNMMFFSGGFYGIKVLLPIMLIWLITTPTEQKTLWYYIVLICSIGFSLLFSISTGPYILVCGILPIFIFYIWKSALKMNHLKDILSKWLLSAESIILYIQMIASVIGIYIGSKMHVDSTGSSMEVVAQGAFMQNVLLQIENIFECFGAFPYHGAQVMSINGISSLFHIAIALLFLIAFISLIGRIKELKDCSLVDAEKGSYYYLYFCIFWNFLIVLFCDTGANPRYMLMTIVMMFPLVAIYYYDFAGKISTSNVQRLFVNVGMLAILVFAVMFSNYKILRNECYPEMSDNNTKYEAVLDVLNSREEQMVVLLDDTGMTEYLRAYDYKSGREYLTYTSNNHKLEAFDYYKSRMDASFLDDRHLMIVDDQLTDLSKLPDYIASSYEEVTSIGNLHILSTLTNRLDGPYGYENNAHSVDFPYTAGYRCYDGDIDISGIWRCSGNDDIVLSSPWLNNAPNQLSVRINYESANSGAIGRLIIWDCTNQESFAETEIVGEDVTVSLDDLPLAGRDICVQVYLNRGCEIGIKSIEYDR